MVSGMHSRVTYAQRVIIEACVAENTHGKRPIAAIRRRTGLSREQARCELKNVHPGQPYTAASAQEIYDRIHPPGSEIMHEPATKEFVDALLREGKTNYQIELRLSLNDNVCNHSNRTVEKYRRFVEKHGFQVAQPAEAQDIEPLEPEARPEHEGEGMVSEVHDPSESADHTEESDESRCILEF